jgi:hypothetical protein
VLYGSQQLHVHMICVSFFRSSPSCNVPFLAPTFLFCFDNTVIYASSVETIAHVLRHSIDIHFGHGGVDALPIILQFSI